MIYITGDTHANFSRFSRKQMPYHLEKVDYKVDYVITHCVSNRIQDKIEERYYGGGTYGRSYFPDILTGYLEEIEGKLQFNIGFVDIII